MKILKSDQLAAAVAAMKAAGKTIVFTNGCFDILHAGHVRYLTAARKLGDCLVVGLNSDQSVRCLKGPNRPVNPQEDRAEVLAGLSAVDIVTIFEEQTAEELVRRIKPAVYVKGGDYQEDQLPEARLAAQYGGKTVLIPAVPGRSSSNIIKKIKG
ncbi:D-glycero-beta-D-manno-heptose 1-phosphate adenylyltransferase|uniref:D-glycero-beta-D-manno-heptose 1-phosphate adenylyltransferase n=1 Tax=Dendrosporobacter quercicolus TaxID=146817 RepID=A0A1G9WNF4_9FIRM|nr:D-glycero-beta-D-manno-heptose 1-phosphate adenylyltransferase [Dendrosporobacter quercicolus]NSL49154.1 D-glycero-beta-D-manno-heptose 1-phosphate adenylyltransferase [Dendrosporobacter quercicolus DSM 1736]SDM85686.1 rfaE bifunctional protein, domain II [Dendrosporobacter quercicolus]